jgi:hypothetical protein
MVFQLPKQITRILTVLAAAVILLLVIFGGWAKGKNQAQATLGLSNAQEIAKGLQYFYSDNNRFPSAAEFQDNRNLMLNYFSSFPPADIPSAQCPQNFSYQRPTPVTFKFNFCLPSAQGDFSAGWNQLTESK